MRLQLQAFNHLRRAMFTIALLCPAMFVGNRLVSSPLSDQHQGSRFSSDEFADRAEVRIRITTEKGRRHATPRRWEVICGAVA